MTFRLAARYVLLTYAQCGDLDPFAIVNLCASLGGECIVGREVHGDGGYHLHAFVDFGKRFNTRDCHKFDIGECHPNITPSRGNPAGGWDYATKDGDICAGGLLRPEDSRIRNTPNKEAWSEILLAPSRAEFFEAIAEHDPRTLLTSFVSLQKYADWHYQEHRADYVSPEIEINTEALFYQELHDWTQNVDYKLTGERYVLLTLNT